MIVVYILLSLLLLLMVCSLGFNAFCDEKKSEPFDADSADDPDSATHFLINEQPSTYRYITPTLHDAPSSGWPAPPGFDLDPTYPTHKPGEYIIVKVNKS